MGFPEPEQFNGADMRSHASTDGTSQPWKCLDCEAAGKGYVSRGKHWHATQHHIVAGFDPRAKTAPRGARTEKGECESLNPQKASQ